MIVVARVAAAVTSCDPLGVSKGESYLRYERETAERTPAAQQSRGFENGPSNPCRTRNQTCFSRPPGPHPSFSRHTDPIFLRLLDTLLCCVVLCAAHAFVAVFVFLSLVPLSFLFFVLPCVRAYTQRDCQHFCGRRDGLASTFRMEPRTLV